MLKIIESVFIFNLIVFANLTFCMDRPKVYKTENEKCIIYKQGDEVEIAVVKFKSTNQFDAIQTYRFNNQDEFIQGIEGNGKSLFYHLEKLWNQRNLWLTDIKN